MVRERCGVMLMLPVEPDRERAAAAARLWFELCRVRLLGLSPDRPGVGAQVGTTVYPPDGYEGGPWEWDAPYSEKSWEEFRQKLETFPSAVYAAWTRNELGEAGRQWLVDMGVDYGFAELGSEIGDAVANDPAGQRVIRATVREVAEVGAPVAVAVSQWYRRYETPLERALRRTITQRAQAVSVLRNYGWLTVLNDEMTERVGGLSRLRASGAFVEAEPLAAGGTWLVATETWDEYGPEQANRLFEVLAPVLPPGRPSLTEFGSPETPGRPQRRIVLPNVVAERDPREITGS